MYNKPGRYKQREENRSSALYRLNSIQFIRYLSDVFVSLNEVVPLDLRAPASSSYNPTQNLSWGRKNGNLRYC